ncbi:MAG TPA: EAL domain-containing protein [Pseudorhodoplanes sp.]|nr:EAL domain-containing protein [Pseudorhodoplanes sp.]
MTVKANAPRPVSSVELPSEIYIPLVDSLYKDGRSLLLGTFFVTASVIATYWKTGEPLLFLVAVAVACVGAARLLAMRSYVHARSTVTTNEIARRWEQRYVTGAATSVGLLGLWCFVAFAQTKDAFAHLVSFSMTIAYVIGIFGRNFGNTRSVIMQILCAWLPMTAALLLYGDTYHWIFAGLLIPFFLAVKFIAERLRSTLLDAVIATRDMSLLASRFDTALTNMPHGLAMFDANGRIVVVNGKLGERLCLPSRIQLKGMTAAQLAATCSDNGLVAGVRARHFTEDLEARLAQNDKTSFVLETEGGLALEFTFQPMANGGKVLLVEDVTERKLAEAKIRHLARFDALTGLPNRTVLRDRMEALANDGRNLQYAVHFIDLDQFKQVNDTLGHHRGDVLLQTVADRLRDTARKSDMIARFGGDEFVVLQSPIKSADEASTLAKRILHSLASTYRIDGHEVVISGSVGIAFAPKDGTDPDQLLRHADMALYRVKAERRGSWRFFRSDMEADAQARRSLELDLRSALESDAFQLHYQPQIDLRTKRVVGCEALLRWPHVDRGMISPAEFIPVAEEMGLIVEMGKQVLRKACEECRHWPPQTRVAVNLSPIQFSRSNIPALVRDVLDETGLPANRLELEITETTLLQDTRRSRAALRQLQALGVSISLDDFGTGYSSLSYLHSFRLDKVKIDQSFLRDLDGDGRKLTLLRGIVRLSAELGMRVAVEGVETEEQLALVAAELGVDEAQGFLFSRPLSGAEIRKLLFMYPPRIEKVA